MSLLERYVSLFYSNCLAYSVPGFPQMSQKCTVAVQDTVNGGKAHIVDSSKIRIIFNDFLLYLFQFNGLVFEDHVNDEFLLLCGEQKTPSAPIRALCRSTTK